MPPTKSKRATQEDSRSEASTARERQVAAAAHARKSKNGPSAANQNGSSLKELALVSTEAGNVVAPGQGGVSASAHQPLVLECKIRV